VTKGRGSPDHVGDHRFEKEIGNAKIHCGTRSLFHLLTRGIARYVRVEFWSWW
jgi:hypothetical protein